MKAVNKIGIALLVATILSGPLSFSIACAVGKADVFGVGGALRYSWFVYFGVVVAIGSVAFSLWTKKRGYSYKKNVIVSCFFAPICLLIGSERHFFTDFYDYSDQIVVSVNKKTGLSIPLNEGVVTTKYGSFNLGIEEIVHSKEIFESSLDARWEVSLELSVENVLPFEASSRAADFNRFLFYDCDSNEFNKVTVEGDVRPCVFLAYSTFSGRLMILDEYEYRA